MLAACPCEALPFQNYPANSCSATQAIDNNCHCAYESQSTTKRRQGSLLVSCVSPTQSLLIPTYGTRLKPRSGRGTEGCARIDFACLAPRKIGLSCPAHRQIDRLFMSKSPPDRLPVPDSPPDRLSLSLTIFFSCVLLTCLREPQGNQKTSKLNRCRKKSHERGK